MQAQALVRVCPTHLAELVGRVCPAHAQALGRVCPVQAQALGRVCPASAKPRFCPILTPSQHPNRFSRSCLREHGDRRRVTMAVPRTACTVRTGCTPQARRVPLSRSTRRRRRTQSRRVPLSASSAARERVGGHSRIACPLAAAHKRAANSTRMPRRRARRAAPSREPGVVCRAAVHVARHRPASPACASRGTGPASCAALCAGARRVRCARAGLRRAPGEVREQAARARRARRACARRAALPRQSGPCFQPNRMETGARYEYRSLIPGSPSLLSRKWRGRRISWRNGGAARGGMGPKFGRAPDVSGPDTGAKSRC